MMIKKLSLLKVDRLSIKYLKYQKERKMKKSELWNKIQEIGKKHELSKEVMDELSIYLEPKKSGSHSERIEKVIEGKTYRNCRFLNLMVPIEDLVYQNDKMREEGKDKGYSKIGISIWNKGQKKIKDLQQKLTDGVLNGEDVTEVASELKEIKEKNLGNNPEWLKQFETDDQKEVVKDYLDID